MRTRRSRQRARNRGQAAAQQWLREIWEDHYPLIAVVPELSDSSWPFVRADTTMNTLTYPSVTVTSGWVKRYQHGVDSDVWYGPTGTTK